MPDILHDFFIRGTPDRVFAAISVPAEVNKWWSLECTGRPEAGGEYRLYFGEPWDWRAHVSRYERDCAFEWEMTVAMDDWVGTRVGFELEPAHGGTKVRFYHRDWAEASEHYRISSYCWAMLLRLLKVYVETGAVMPHAERLQL
ncbi:MAG: SRPBCC domain-containing protein [Flavobacteriales bacterium]|nr:SRPBCC domain-containing protein [Flavobacteriales bacterium]